MNYTKYDDLYNYLSAFQDCSPEDIACYLSDLGEKRFDSFVQGLAMVMPEADGRFDNVSKFNFSVDSTLSGGDFPCKAKPCRENNLNRLACFAAQYADKVSIKSPIDNAFSEHDGFVDIEELAFGIYLTMKLEQVVKAGYVEFSDGYVLLCEKCLANQLNKEAMVEKSLQEVWGQLVEDFCQTTTCVLTPYDDGGFYIAIHGMDAYGSHEEMDIDFKQSPQIYIDILKQRGRSVLSKDEIIQGGLPSLLMPVLSDYYSALVNPSVQGGSYLTTRSAQIQLLSKPSNPAFNDSRTSDRLFQVSCNLPFAENASLDSLIDFRKRNEEAFLVFRDQISQNACSILSNEREAYEFRRDVIDPELHKIKLLMTRSRNKVVTIAGMEALIGVATIAIGQYCGLSAADAVGIVANLGAGSLCQAVIDCVTNEKAKENPMYFLWQIERKTKKSLPIA